MIESEVFTSFRDIRVSTRLFFFTRTKNYFIIIILYFLCYLNIANNMKIMCKEINLSAII
jgi:hypothetical protein